MKTNLLNHPKLGIALLLSLSILVLILVRPFGFEEKSTEVKTLEEKVSSRSNLTKLPATERGADVAVQTSSRSSSLVEEYAQLYGKYQVKAFANHKFSILTDKEIEALRLEFIALDQLYYKIPLEESKKVKRVSFPYAQLEIDGKVSYKKFADLTPAERKSLNC